MDKTMNNRRRAAILTKLAQAVTPTPTRDLAAQAYANARLARADAIANRKGASPAKPAPVTPTPVLAAQGRANARLVRADAIANRRGAVAGGLAGAGGAMRAPQPAPQRAKPLGPPPQPAPQRAKPLGPPPQPAPQRMRPVMDPPTSAPTGAAIPSGGRPKSQRSAFTSGMKKGTRAYFNQLYKMNPAGFRSEVARYNRERRRPSAKVEGALGFRPKMELIADTPAGQARIARMRSTGANRAAIRAVGGIAGGIAGRIAGVPLPNYAFNALYPRRPRPAKASVRPLPMVSN